MTVKINSPEHNDVPEIKTAKTYSITANRSNCSMSNTVAAINQSIKNELILVAQNRRLFLGHFTQLIVYSWNLEWVSECVGFNVPLDT